MRADIDRLYGMEKRQYEGEYVITTRRGEQRTWEFSSSPLGRMPDGRRLVLSMAVDISERKQAEMTIQQNETRLNYSLQSAELGAWELNLADGTAWRSLRHDQIFGYQTLLPVWTFDMFLEHVLPEDRGEVKAKYDQAVATATDWRFECRIRRSDGVIRWIWAKGAPEFNAHHKPVRMFGVVQDISEYKQAETEVRALNAELEQRVAARTAELSERVAEVEQLNQAMTNLLEDLQAANRQATEAAEQLKAANAELGTFTYSVSHDLKAPLRGIDGYSRLLEEDYTDRLDEDGRRFLRNIRSAAMQMSQLIDDLLTYSRLERRTLTRAAVNPAALTAAVVAERAEEVRARGVRLAVEVACASAIAEPEGLIQALRNLLDNALKFTHDTPNAAISIGSRETESSCILWVADNGSGFEMKYSERIFEIFQRLHRAEDYPGTGIGLAIVRKAMQRMGGRAWAESAPGKGATFYLEIPK